MGLSYHYSFRAPASAKPEVLADFLRGVEGDAALMGFAPTVVVTGPFDTPERRNFARRVARGLVVEDPRLTGVDLPKENFWSYYPQSGVCRLAPSEGALLVVTDECGMETVFGFYRFPESIVDRAGRKIMDVPQPGEWTWAVSWTVPIRVIARSCAGSGRQVISTGSWMNSCQPKRAEQSLSWESVLRLVFFRHEESPSSGN